MLLPLRIQKQDHCLLLSLTVSTTIEDTKTGPLSLTVTTDRVQTVSVTTIEDTKTGPLSLTVTTDRVQTEEVLLPLRIQKQDHCLLLLLLIEFKL